MVDSYTLNWTENKLIVTFQDGTTKEYTQADEYIADHPNRVADAVAMGWEVPVVEAPVITAEE